MIKHLRKRLKKSAPESKSADLSHQSKFSLIYFSTIAWSTRSYAIGSARIDRAQFSTDGVSPSAGILSSQLRTRPFSVSQSTSSLNSIPGISASSSDSEAPLMRQRFSSSKIGHVRHNLAQRRFAEFRHIADPFAF